MTVLFQVGEACMNLPSFTGMFFLSQWLRQFVQHFSGLKFGDSTQTMRRADVPKPFGDKLWGSTCEVPQCIWKGSLDTFYLSFTLSDCLSILHHSPSFSPFPPLHSGLGSFRIFRHARNSSVHCLPLGAMVAVIRSRRAGKVVMVLFLCTAIMILFFFLNLRLGWTACAILRVCHSRIKFLVLQVVKPLA